MDNLFAAAFLQELGDQRVQATIQAGNERFHQGRFRDAIQAWQTALEYVDPARQARLYFSITIAAQNLGNLQTALISIEEALLRNPALSDAHRIKGDILKNMGRYADALQAYRNEPVDSLQIWDSAASCYKMLDRPEKSLPLYDQILLRQPFSWSAYNNKGDSLNLLGKYSEALGCFDKALQIADSDTVCLENKAYALHQLGRYKEAKHFCEKSFAAAKTGWPYIILASCHFHLGNTLEANQAFNQGTRLIENGSWFSGVPSPRERKNAQYLRESIEKTLREANSASHSSSSRPNGTSRFHSFEAGSTQCNTSGSGVAPSEKTSNMTCSYSSLHSSRQNNSGVTAENQEKATILLNEAIDAENEGNLDKAKKLLQESIQVQPQYAYAHENKGNVLLKMHEFSSANEAFTKAIQLIGESSNSVDSLVGKACCLSHMGHDNEAFKYVDKALTLDPYCSDAWIQKGDLQKKDAKHEEAASCYDKAIECDPNSSTAHCQKAVSLLKLGKLNAASKFFNRALSIDSKHVQSNIGKGDLLCRLNDYENGIEYYDKAIAANADNVDACFNKAVALEKTDRVRDAIKCYNKVLSMNPSHRSAIRNRARAEERLDSQQASSISYNRNVRRTSSVETDDHDKHTAVRLYNDAITHDESGKHREALNLINQALKIHPRYLFAIQTKGDILLNLEQCEKSIKAYDEALKLDPENPDILLGKAIASAGISDFDAALQLHDTAIEKDRGFPLAHARKGETYNKMGKYNEALECMNKAISLDETCVQAYCGKGQALRCLGSYEEALQAFNDALQQLPGDCSLKILKGDVLLAKQDFFQAFEHFDKVVDEHGQNVNVFAKKGIALYHLDKLDDALKCFEETLSMDADHTEARTYKNTILKAKKQHISGEDKLGEAISSAVSNATQADLSLYTKEQFESFRQILSQFAQEADSFVTREEIPSAIRHEHEEKELQYIQSKKRLSEFYNGLNSTLFDKFMAACVIQSGYVKADTGSSYFAMGLSALSFLLQSVPIGSHICSGVQNVMQCASRFKTEVALENLLNRIPDRSMIKSQVAEISRCFTLIMEDDISGDFHESNGFWDSLKLYYKSIFFDESPKSMYYAEGATHGLAIVKLCMQAEIDPAEFGPVPLLKSLVDEDAPERLREKRASLSNLQYNIATSVELTTVGSGHHESHSQMSIAYAVSGSTTTEDKNSNMEEYKRTIDEMTVKFSSLERKITEISKKLPEGNTIEEVNGETESQVMMTSKQQNSSVRNTGKADSEKMYQDLRDEIQELRTTLNYYENTSIGKSVYIERHLEGANIPFDRAVSRLYQMICETFGDKHKYVTKSNKSYFDGNSVIIDDELRGNKRYYPGIVDGKDIAGFFLGQSTLWKVPRQKIVDNFKEYAGESPQHFGANTMGTDVTTERAELLSGSHF